MPIVNGIGCSEFTFEKQEIFHGIMDMHTSIVKSIIGRGKAAPAYYYFDLTAGAGLYQDDKKRWIIGSPIRAIAHLQTKEMEYFATLYEATKENADVLRNHLTMFNRHANTICVINADSAEVIKEKLNGGKPKYGIIYADTNATIPPFETFTKLANISGYSCIDFMTTYAASSHKRQIKAGHCDAKERLPEILSKINKKFWLIREPTGKHQWTFLIGTNWANFPQWNKRGFFGITTQKGAEIYKQIWMTKAELFDGLP